MRNLKNSTCKCLLPPTTKRMLLWFFFVFMIVKFVEIILKYSIRALTNISKNKKVN